MENEENSDKVQITAVQDLPVSEETAPQTGGPRLANKGARLWAIIIGLGITNLLAALENTVVTVSAPVILTDLKLGGDFIWLTNAFFVTRSVSRSFSIWSAVQELLTWLNSAAFQPLFGQLCNVFGRRWVMLSIIAIFTLGSGICGGAKNGAMLIGGRAVQGLGSGGIIMVTGTSHSSFRVLLPQLTFLPG
jgi:MFS family permease